MNFDQAILGIFSGVHWGAWSRAVILLLVGGLLASALARGLSKITEDRLSLHQRVMLRRALFYLVMLLFVIAALREAGFQLSVLLGAAGILTVAIGFAAQTSASNVISGLFLVSEKAFEIGHVIEVDGSRGEVIAIDFLSVKLKTADNVLVRIPNETMIKSKVLNLTRFPIRRIDLPVGIAYGDDIDRAKNVLLALAESNPLCLEEPAAFVAVTAFGASSVDLQFSFWVRTADILSVRSDMMRDLKLAFEQQGIEIPFPQMTLNPPRGAQAFRVESNSNIGRSS